MKYFLEWTLYIKTVLKNMFIYTWANPIVIQLKKEKHNETMFNDKAMVGHLQVTTKS